MDLFQLCILHVQIFINFLCLLELLNFYFCTLRLHNTKPLLWQVLMTSATTSNVFPILYSIHLLMHCPA